MSLQEEGLKEQTKEYFELNFRKWSHVRTSKINGKGDRYWAFGASVKIFFFSVQFATKSDLPSINETKNRLGRNK